MIQTGLLQFEISLLKLPRDGINLPGLLFSRAADLIRLFFQCRILAQAKLQLKFAQFFTESSETLSSLSLPFQTIHLPPHFTDNVTEAQQILAGRIDFTQSGFFTGLELGDTGSFFNQAAAILGLGINDHADLTLFNNGIGTVTNPGIHEEFCDVQQTTGSFIQQIFALTIAVEPPCDLNLGILSESSGRQAGGIVHNQSYLGHTKRLTTFAPAEDNVFH